MNRLKDYVIQSGRSQNDIADMIGVTPMTFNGYVKGTCTPNVLIALEIAKILQTSVEDIWDD